MEEATKIWGAFETARNEYERVDGEHREAEEADEEWGYGELEETKGEYELAMRGYGV
ncbi:hypothetical protein Q9L58_010168 [Maublancomyces gigas]|uniref:Uncharacterized protein n=1 Tax=Discina gigas TaxID=1032678 RepID=A0ABR3G4U8_9PEZI